MPLQHKWIGASAIALAIGLTACSGGGPASAPAVPPVATPTPPPPPPPPPTFVGAVYVGTNNFGDAGNYVVAFGRSADGSLGAIDAYPTGGTGRGVFRDANGPPRLNPLISEDSLIAIEERYLLVVNAGSNTITSFAIQADFSLRRVDQEASGGTSPVSLAHRNGLVYVANADADGVFSGAADQSGNVAGLRIDLATGQLSPIAGSTRALGVRPSDLEFSLDGRHLLVSASNAGSATLAGRSTAELSSFGLLPDGTLTATPSGTGASTLPGNAAGRNLPTAIGMETFTREGRQLVMVAEAREYRPDGRPGALAEGQTGSVSTWEIAANGALLPRSLDVLAGPTRSSGPTGTGWIAIGPPYDLFYVSSSTGAAISVFGARDDGTTSLVDIVARGGAANPGAANPLAQADGFVDLVITPFADGPYLYQLLGLKGSVAQFDVDTLTYNISLRQVARSGLLPLDNLQGIASVSRRAP